MKGFQDDDDLMFKVKIKIALLKFVIVKAQLIYCYNDGRCFISYC